MESILSRPIQDVSCVVHNLNANCDHRKRLFTILHFCFVKLSVNIVHDHIATYKATLHYLNFTRAREATDVIVAKDAEHFVCMHCLCYLQHLQPEALHLGLTSCVLSSDAVRDSYGLNLHRILFVNIFVFFHNRATEYIMDKALGSRPLRNT